MEKVALAFTIRDKGLLPLILLIGPAMAYGSFPEDAAKLGTTAAHSYYDHGYSSAGKIVGKKAA